MCAHPPDDRASAARSSVPLSIALAIALRVRIFAADRPARASRCGRARRTAAVLERSRAPRAAGPRSHSRSRSKVAATRRWRRARQSRPDAGAAAAGRPPARTRRGADRPRRARRSRRRGRSSVWRKRHARRYSTIRIGAGSSGSRRPAWRHGRCRARGNGRRRTGCESKPAYRTCAGASSPPACRPCRRRSRAAAVSIDMM